MTSSSTHSTQVGSFLVEEEAHQQVMQLEFNQAMSDFHIMFPGVDSDVIEAVLRANAGVVDATIDQLLTMVADDEVERCRARSEEENPHTCSSVRTDSEPSLIRPAVGVKNLAPAPTCAILGVPLCQSRGWRPTLLQPLPPDFLRLDRGPRSPRHPELLPSGRLLLMQQQRLEAGDDEAIEKQDERLAMFLQNAEFVQALKSDADFMRSLDEEQEQQAAVRPRKQQQAALPAAGVRPADEEAAFREKLRQMGKVPSRKLAQLARTFFRGRPGAKEQPIMCDQDEEWSHADTQAQQQSHK